MAIPRWKLTKNHFFFTLGKSRAVARAEKNLEIFCFKLLLSIFFAVLTYMTRFQLVLFYLEMKSAMAMMVSR